MYVHLSAPQHLGLPGTSGGQAWHLNSTCLNTVATSQLDGDWKEGLGEMILLLVKAQAEAIISPFEGGFLMLPLCSPQPKQHLPSEGQSSILQEAHLSEPTFQLHFSEALGLSLLITVSPWATGKKIPLMLVFSHTALFIPDPVVGRQPADATVHHSDHKQPEVLQLVQQAGH